MIRRYGYMILLVTLVFLLLVAPLLNGRVGEQWIVHVLVYATFLAGLANLSRNTGSFKTLLALIFVAFSLNFVSTNAGNHLITLAAVLTNISLYAYLTCLILNDIFFKHDDVSFDMICGAICVYLFIGMFFAFVYILIQCIDPNAFAGVKFIDANEPMDSVSGFIYFSFVTLTTLGYGDISPNTIEAGSFVYMETIIGQVYMTVLVARLVGMHIAQNGK